MIKFIVDEQESAQGVHYIHNATEGCEDLPEFDNQILIGYFANYDLADPRQYRGQPAPLNF